MNQLNSIYRDSVFSLRRIAFILISLFYISSFGQNATINQNISFDQLVKLEDSLQEIKDWEGLQFVFDQHIKRAKHLNDTLELISTYDWRMQFSTPLVAEVIADSALTLAKISKNNAARSHLHYSIGTLLYSKNLPVKALNRAIQGYLFNNNIKNIAGIIECLNLIASIKREYGQKHEALYIQKASYQILKSSDDKIDNYNEILLYTLEALSKCYISVNELELALKTAEEGKKLALMLGIQEMVISFDTTIGQSNYYMGNYPVSDTILTRLSLKTEGESRADILFYLGQIQLNKNRISNTIRYYRQIDSILAKKGYPLIDNAEQVYQTLLESTIYEEDQDWLKEHYLSRIIYYDSLKAITNYNIEKIAHIKFDLKRELNQNLTKDSQSLFSFVLCGILFCVGTYIFLIRKTLLLSAEKIQPRTENDSQKVPDEVRNGILRELKRWELNEGFLHPNTTQVELAELLGTNSTYLSRIINQELGKSYSNYIKELRTTYMISDFEKNHQELGKKSMIQLAERYGFRSQYAFINTFKLRTGITPSVYLRKKKYSI